MVPVLIRCPLTERLVPTGLLSPGEVRFRKSLPRSAMTDCIACRRIHAWSREEAILEGRQRRDRAEAAG